MSDLTPEEIREYLEDANPDAYLVDDMDVALIGVARRPCEGEVAVYDEDRCIQYLVDEGMEWEEAIAFYEFNVVGAYLGPNTPIFMLTISP